MAFAIAGVLTLLGGLVGLAPTGALEIGDGGTSVTDGTTIYGPWSFPRVLTANRNRID